MSSQEDRAKRRKPKGYYGVRDIKRYDMLPSELYAARRRDHDYWLQYKESEEYKQKQEKQLTAKQFYDSTVAERGILRRAKYRAKRKGLDFNLTLEDISIPEYCPVLGLKLESKNKKGSKKSGANLNSPTLDRLDNTKGYIKGNVFVISNRANFLKNDASVEDIENILRYMKNGLP